MEMTDTADGGREVGRGRGRGRDAARPFADPAWYDTLASPYYRASHRRLALAVRTYLDAEILPHCEEWESAGRIPDAVMQRHAQLGFIAAGLYPPPAAYMAPGLTLPGGVPADEWDAFHDLITIDEVARCGYLGIVWGLTCGNTIGTPPLINYGSDVQKRRFLPDVLRGATRFCLGITEPDAGSDVAGIATTAVLATDRTHYLVNGAKKWITNGIWANYCTAAVRTGGPGASGISALIIPLDAPGVERRRMFNSGVSASGSTFLSFDNVLVPAENLIGKENDGFKIIMSNFNHERLWLGVTSLRLARVCVEDAYAHAIKRTTFNKKLIENQVILAKFTEMGGLIEPVHALAEQIVYHITRVPKQQADTDLAGYIALFKVQAALVLEKCNREAQQVMGGLGYSRGGRGGRIEQISRDLRCLVVGGGSHEILTQFAIKHAIAKFKASL